MLAALLSLAFLYADVEARMVKRNLSAFSEVLAHELGSRTAAVASQLQRWRDDDRLRAALLDGRSNLLRAKEEELALLVPGAIGVVLLTATDTLPGGGAGERLSYAGVEMARKVRQTGQMSLLEAHRVNEDDEHLAISGPVMDAAGERVLGVVHLMLPLSLLPTAGDMQSQSAQFQYRQRAGERMVLIGSDQRDAPQAEASTERIVPGQARCPRRCPWLARAWCYSPGPSLAGCSPPSCCHGSAGYTQRRSCYSGSPSGCPFAASGVASRLIWPVSSRWLRMPWTSDRCVQRAIASRNFCPSRVACDGCCWNSSPTHVAEAPSPEEPPVSDGLAGPDVAEVGAVQPGLDEVAEPRPPVSPSVAEARERGSARRCRPVSSAPTTCAG